MNRNRSEPEPVCTVLYSTFYSLWLKKIKNAPRRGVARFWFFFPHLYTLDKKPFIRYDKKNQKRAAAGRCAFLIFFHAHLGSCFGMNGHPRGATDVILRLSWSTIDFLSVFISFRSQITSKWSFYMKILTLNKFLSKNWIFFEIWFSSGDHSRRF